MKKLLLVLGAAVLLAGVGCSANSDVTTPSNGLRVNGSVDVTGDGSGTPNNY